MNRTLVVLIVLFRLAIPWAWLALPVIALGQPDAADGQKAFFDNWRQAMLAGDEAKAKQLALSDPETGQKVAQRVGVEARGAFKGGDKQRALELFTVTQHLFEHLGDKEGIAIASSDLGTYHASAGECPLALPQLVRASGLLRDLSLLDRRAIAAHGIQRCVMELAVADPSASSVNLKVSPEGEQVIVYNRQWCKEAGMEVCGFYLVHEYAHIFLGHATNDVSSNRSEPEADCWAARHASLEWTKAAHAWFTEGAPSPAVHVRSAARAEAIRRCGGF